MLFSLCLVRLMLIPDNADDWKVRKKEVNIHWISSLRRLLPISSFSCSEKDEKVSGRKTVLGQKDASKLNWTPIRRSLLLLTTFCLFLHEYIAEGCGQVREGEKSIAVSGGHTPWLPSVHSHIPCWGSWRTWGGGWLQGGKRPWSLIVFGLGW